MTFENNFLNLLHKLLYSTHFWLSNFLVYLMNSIFSYPKNLVFQNISISFSEKNEKKINQIGAYFYRNLADLIVGQATPTNDFEITNRYVQLMEQSIYINTYN